jgi:lipoic acid synthetase
MGNEKALLSIAQVPPHVFNHNVETVPRLYREVRPQASYNRSLRVLELAKQVMPGVFTKSGLMVGLGESREEVISVLGDLRSVRCDIVTIGQYLRPTMQHLPVARFVPPEEFKEYEEVAYSMGFRWVASGPFVRSSYLADAFFASLEKGARE